MQNHLDLYPNLVSTRKSICTQKELSELIGISQQEISRYERGEVKAPITYLIDIAAICNVSVDYILGLSNATAKMLSNEENELINIFKKLSIENKIRLIERAKSLYDFQNSST